MHADYLNAWHLGGHAGTGDNCLRPHVSCILLLLAGDPHRAHLQGNKRLALDVKEASPGICPKGLYNVTYS